LYDTRNELEDMENERDMAVEETSNLQYDLDEKETELYDMTEKADRLDDNLLEATEKIEELEAQL
jgi:septal ring factor EnvC (AmiA/AmiB activator)